jgi:hypothetical protein
MTPGTSIQAPTNTIAADDIIRRDGVELLI